jgi:hypothetical protein
LYASLVDVLAMKRLSDDMDSTSDQDIRTIGDAITKIQPFPLSPVQERNMSVNTSPWNISVTTTKKHLVKWFIKADELPGMMIQHLKVLMEGPGLSPKVAAPVTPKISASYTTHFDLVLNSTIWSEEEAKNQFLSISSYVRVLIPALLGRNLTVTPPLPTDFGNSLNCHADLAYLIEEEASPKLIVEAKSVRVTQRFRDLILGLRTNGPPEGNFTHTDPPFESNYTGERSIVAKVTFYSVVISEADITPDQVVAYSVEVGARWAMLYGDNEFMIIYIHYDSQGSTAFCSNCHKIDNRDHPLIPLLVYMLICDTFEDRINLEASLGLKVPVADPNVVQTEVVTPEQSHPATRSQVAAVSYIAP